MDLQKIINNIPDYVDLDLTHYTFKIKHDNLICIHFNNGSETLNQAIEYVEDKYYHLINEESRDYSPDEAFEAFSQFVHNEIVKFENIKNNLYESILRK